MNHMQLYDRWLSHSLEDADLIAELEAIKGKDDEIFDRFYRDLSLGQPACAACLARVPIG